MNSSMAINGVSFGAKINTIPKLSKMAKKEIGLTDVKMEGYTAFIGGDVYTPNDKIMKADLLFKDKKLVAINDFDEHKVGQNINYVLLEDETIAPAILDEHIHGGYGIDFHTSSEDEMRGLLKRFKEIGIGGVVATTLPGTIEHIKGQIQRISRIMQRPDPDAAKLYGIHLEGPFLSPKKAGIHPPEILINPTVENYLSMNPENVRIVTFAPERDGGKELAKYLHDNGVIASAGHSAAKAEQTNVEGITQVTHVFNAMAPFHHRDLTIANEALWNDALSVEMNSDTSLLNPKTMDIIMRAKPKSKVILISDALPQAGNKKDFIMNGVKINVHDDWTAISDDGILAGAMQFLPNYAKHLIESTRMKFQDFIRFSSANPSRNLGVQKEFSLSEGLSPNFTVWNNKTVLPEKTFIN